MMIKKLLLSLLALGMLNIWQAAKSTGSQKSKKQELTQSLDSV